MRLFAFLVAASFAFAQDSTIRVNVNLIQIDVTVLDKSGKHVPDLTVDDFEVTREGKRQVLKSALWVSGQRVSAQGVAANLPTAGAAAPVVSKTIRPQDVRRTIALLVDDLSLSFVSSHYARNAMKDFVEKNIQPGDLVALFRTSTGLGVLQQFTTDKRQLLAQIDATRFRSINSVDSLAPVTNNPLEDSGDPTLAAMAMEQRLRDEINDRQRQDMVTSTMLASVQFVVNGLRELPGRKSLILFSESMQMFDAPRAMTNPGMTSDMMQMPGAMGGARERTVVAIRKLVDASNRAGVVLYTIDPRGLVYTGMTAADAPSGNSRRAMGQMQQRQMDFNQSQDGMAMLAEETGGVFYRNTNDISAALTAALEDQEGYYLLAFQPDDATFEKSKEGPKFQKLNVKVKRGGLKVRYRHGFYSVADEDGKPVAPIISAMTSPFQAVELPIKMTPIFLSDGAGKPLLRTLVHIDPSAFTFREAKAETTDKNQEAWKLAVIDQLVVLYNQSGQPVRQVSKSHQVQLRGEGYAKVLKAGLAQEMEMEVPGPGAYQIRTAIQDQGSKKTGSATQFIEIPDLKNKRLAMSDLVVSSEGWMERNETEGGPAQRIVRPGASLSYGAMVYNAKLPKGSSSANLETQVVLFRDGKVAYTGKKTPFQPDGYKEGESLSVTGALRLGAKSAAGEYVLQVAVRDLDAPKKYQISVRSVEFEVRP